MMFSRRILLGVSLLVVLSVTWSCSDTMTGSEEENSPPEFNSNTAPGDSAKSFLEGDQYSTLNLEIDYMEGYEPTQQALDSLKTFLNQHLNKANINIGIPNSIPAEGRNAYSADDIRSLEQKHRDHFTAAGSDTLWAYFIIADAEYSQQNVLGIAYYNTSMAFFGQTITDNSGGVGQDEQYEIEGTVFRHEFGHVLGLVNGGTPMQQDHQDEANGHHCTQEECVMYYQTNTTDFFANTMDGPLPNLLQHCRQDLEAHGGR